MADAKEFQKVEFERGIFKAIVWQTYESDTEDTFRYSAFIPVGTKGFPDGKIIAGGLLGYRVESIEAGIDACEEAIAEQYRAKAA